MVRFTRRLSMVAVLATLPSVASAQDNGKGFLFGEPAGSVTIDAGALRALLEGKSLLPAGIIKARGRFERGDTVSVLTMDGAEVARGIIAYSDVDAARIMGRKSSEIEGILGFRGRDEMIHRDNLVLTRPGGPDAAEPGVGAAESR